MDEYVNGSRTDLGSSPESEDSLPVSHLLDPALHQPRTGCPFHDIRGLLKDAGLRPTRQRLALGWLLFAKGNRHISAETLHEEAQRARFPVSLATVYNTLHQFTDAGLLRELAVNGTSAFFDTNIGEHHHYYVEGENLVLDVQPSHLRVEPTPEPPAGYEVARVDVVVRLRRKRS